MVAGRLLAGPKFPIGDYIDNEGNFTSFHVDGSFWVRNANTEKLKTTHGEYSTRGEIITFSKNSLCPQGEGVYQWALEEDRLLFELIEDDCNERIRALSLDITRYKYGE